MASRLPLTIRPALRLAGFHFKTADFGAGVGSGSAAAGAVRAAGGTFAKLEAANEEVYFRKVQGLQLKRIKEHLEEEVDYHEKAIREHQEAIERHKKKIQKLHHHEKDMGQ